MPEGDVVAGSGTGPRATAFSAQSGAERLPRIKPPLGA